MAVKIRLRRVGAKKAPIYRIVAADSRSPRDGRYLEIVGQYNPLTEPSTIVLNHDRIMYWLKTGATPTDVVKKMLVNDGLWEKFSGEKPAPKPVKAVKAEVVKEEVIEEAAPAAEVTEIAEEAPVVEEEVEEVVEEAPAVEELAEVVEEAPAAEEAVETEEA